MKRPNVSGYAAKIARKKQRMKIDLNFTTDYGQFYLNDKNFIGQTDSQFFWTDEAYENKIAVEKGILGICIGNDEGIVKCEIQILDSKSTTFDFTKSDHVVEASLTIQSGVLQVLDCPFSEIEFQEDIENGEYRVRVYSKNLESAYNENPNDSYLIEIWKENFSEPIVLKKYLG